jgi:hypothetical protein
MPLFNALFAYIFFHAFQRSTNMYAVLGVRDGQSYNGLLERKLPEKGNVLSELSDTEFVITEHTIALCHLPRCLDSGISEKRKKQEVYNVHVATLQALSGQGPRNWRTELAECLSKWHPVFQKLSKHRKSSHEVNDVMVANVQVDASLL